jgi:mannose/cellobiose epimerase-like protein (N-acyl-D-glucosamine 2-epimerase family)
MNTVPLDPPIGPSPSRQPHHQPDLGLPDRAWRRRQAQALLDFALGAVCQQGGFGWLDDAGRIDPAHDRELWIHCRMTHVAAIGVLLGHPGCAPALEHGVAGLTGLFHDNQYGGWYAALGWDDQPSQPAKVAYAHAFVILAASSATTAGHPAGRALLAQALEVSDSHFWDEGAQMVVEQWDQGFTDLDPYRGVNANMHTVEAYLAAGDTLSDLGDQGASTWRSRALAILDRVVNRWARTNGWRLPEHFAADWTPLPHYNRDQPSDPFRPYGATIGHGLEWARLCLQAQASLPEAPQWLGPAAQALYQRAVADGWAVDGAPGFVYTTDWDGTPVVHQRMHWVVAEAIGAADALRKAGRGDATADLTRWWRYADQYLIDHHQGSWHHELDRHNQPSATVWCGKPDIYHALQATVLPDLPLAGAIVPALARG